MVIKWNEQQEPVNGSCSKILYDLSCDKENGALLFDSICWQDIFDYADEFSIFDGLAIENKVLERFLTARVQMALINKSKNTPEVAPVLDDKTGLSFYGYNQPFIKNGRAMVAAIFNLADGQTITIFFGNFDSNSKKLLPTDQLISFKWLLNKTDITVHVAPEKGVDLKVQEIAARVIKLAAKNHKSFMRSKDRNAKAKANIDQLTAEKTDLESQLAQKQDVLAQKQAELKALDEQALNNPTPVVSAPPEQVNESGIGNNKNSHELENNSSAAIEQAAHAAATSPLNNLSEPTQAQKDEGNYKKGHVTFQGLDIAIENPAGSTRSGVSEDGKEWTSTLAHHYGYLKGTVGMDGDPVDVFIGDKPDSEKAFIVNQLNPTTKEPDEHKIMLGFDSEAAAKAGYLANYEADWQGFGSITEVPVSELKTMIEKGSFSRPVETSEQQPVENMPNDANSIVVFSTTKEFIDALVQKYGKQKVEAELSDALLGRTQSINAVFDGTRDLSSGELKSLNTFLDNTTIMLEYPIASEPKQAESKNLKTLDIDVIKKNQKFFKIKVGNYECKLVLDENSKDLHLGKQILLVEDVSIKTKYGTDVIYKLAGNATESNTQNTGIITVDVPYNKAFVEKAKKLGGKWDSDSKTWVFSNLVKDEVEVLENKYGSELVPVEITFNDNDWRGKDAYSLAGIVLATATGRDGGAKVGKDISVIKGGFDSGGSVKNWATEVKKGTVIRMMMPKALIDDVDDSDIEIRILNGNDNTATQTLTPNNFDAEIEQLKTFIGKPEFSDALDNLINKLEAAGVDKQYESAVSDIINQDAQAESAKVGG